MQPVNGLTEFIEWTVINIDMFIGQKDLIILATHSNNWIDWVNLKGKGYIPT